MAKNVPVRSWDVLLSAVDTHMEFRLLRTEV